MTKSDNLSETISDLNKRYGKGSVMPMAKSDVAEAIEVIPTGIKTVDEIIGVGGVPKGRIVEVYGPESGGKTTLALQIAAQAQKQGGIVAYIDAEQALNMIHASSLGVNVEDILVSQPTCGEEALEIALGLIQSGAVALVIVDSVAALTPRAELEGDIGDSMMGVQARMMGQAMRKMVEAVARTNTVLLFINQVRDKIGVMFGSPETTSGGRALKFYASLRLDVRRIAQIKKSDVIVGAKTKVKVAKNKMAPPLRECEVSLIYGKGFMNE